MPDKRNSHSRHSNGQSKRLRPGQPAKCCKLDDALEKRLCRYVREGLPYEACCALVGISKQTFFSWRARGEAESEANTRYTQFAKNVERANAEAMRTLHTAVKASNPQWILERRFPHHYGPPKQRLETELSAAGGAPAAITPFTVNITCTGTEQEHEYPVVDGETGLPVADQLNPYKNGH
jgi:hypothetical protein